MWQARVSPDGQTLAYSAGNEALGAAIFTAPVAGGDEFQVTDWELMSAHPDWTPDGRMCSTSGTLQSSRSSTSRRTCTSWTQAAVGWSP